MKEFRQLSKSDLRSLCIRQNWYTLGNNEEYNKMFGMTEKANLTTEDIVEIATDIKEHSNTNHDITSICFEIARICYSLFEEEV